MKITNELISLITFVENEHFRTVHDTGNTPQARTIWHCLRAKVGLPPIHHEDLAVWDTNELRYLPPANSGLLSVLLSDRSVYARPEDEGLEPAAVLRLRIERLKSTRSA